MTIKIFWFSLKNELRDGLYLFLSEEGSFEIMSKWIAIMILFSIVKWTRSCSPN